MGSKDKLEREKMKQQYRKQQPIVYGRKSKTTAQILAVFLSQWTWLYTYREDYDKFWIGTVLNLFLWWTLVVPIGIWIWAMVNAGTKPREWYDNYHKGA